MWEDESKEFLSHNIGKIIKEKLMVDLGFISEQVRNKQQILAREEHRIKSEVSINIKSEMDYLARASELNTTGFSIKCLHVSNKEEYLLISEDINNSWSQEQENAKSIKSVYNLHDLGDYEYQALTLWTMDKQEYDKSRNMIFDQMGATV